MTERKTKEQRIKTVHSWISKGIVPFVKGCGRLDSKTEDSFFLNFFKRLSLNRRFIKPVKYTVTHAKDESLVVYVLSYLGRILLSLDILNYGTFLLLFSITSFLSECARLLINTNSVLGIDYTFAIRSFVIFISSLFLIFGGRNKSLSEGILGSRIMSFFVFKLFGVRKESLRIQGAGSELLYTILLGVFCGIATLKIPQEIILYRIILMVLGVIVLNVPEAGIVMTMLFAPFFGDLQLLMFVLFVWLAFALKLFWGKRSFKLTFTDTVVIFFALCLLLAGTVCIGKSQPERGVQGMGLVLSFVLVSTLIKNRAWIDRCRLAITISTVFYGLISVIGALAGYVLDKLFIDFPWVAYIPSVLPEITKHTGYFLLLGIFFVFAFFSSKEKNLGRFNILILSVVLTLGIFLTRSWHLWLAFIVGALVYMIYTKPKLVYFVIPSIVLALVVFIFLPSGIKESVMDFAGFSREGFSEAMEQTKALFRITLDNLWGGIGFSDNTIKAYLWDIYPENVTISHEYTNTFLLMTLQLGIFGILLFLLIFLLVIGAYTVWGRSRRADKNLSLVGVSTISMLAAFIFLGFLEFVFSDVSVSLMFWMTGGLAYAATKVIKDEACGIEEADLAVFHVNKKKAEVISDAELGEGEV